MGAQARIVELGLILPPPNKRSAITCRSASAGIFCICPVSGRARSMAQ